MKTPAENPQASIWDEIKRTRAAVTVEEFLTLMGWSHTRLSRHGSKIRTIEGYGRRMIAVSEVCRILGESEEPKDAA